MQRIVHATEETTVTQQLSHRDLSNVDSGTKVNVSCLYRSDSVRLDTRKLNNTSLLHLERKQNKRRRGEKRRKENKCRTKQPKRDSRSSNIPE